jgi:hypothetical protein
MNTSTSLDVMVKMGAFEKMPKQGSITAEELGKLIKLPTGIVGKYFHHLKFKLTNNFSPSNENAHRNWRRRSDR